MPGGETTAAAGPAGRRLPTAGPLRRVLVGRRALGQHRRLTVAAARLWREAAQAADPPLYAACLRLETLALPPAVLAARWRPGQRPHDVAAPRNRAGALYVEARANLRLRRALLAAAAALPPRGGGAMASPAAGGPARVAASPPPPPPSSWPMGMPPSPSPPRFAPVPHPLLWAADVWLAAAARQAQFTAAPACRQLPPLGAPRRGLGLTSTGRARIP